MANDWGEDAEDRRVDRRLVRRVLGYFRPYWRAGLLALACLGAGAVLGLAPALVFRALIDYLGGGAPHFGHVSLLIGAGIGAAIAAGLIGLSEDYLTERISQGIIFDLREQLFDRLVNQSVGFYTHNRAGEVMSRIGNDVNDIENVVADTIFGVADNVLVAGTTLALMIAFDWRLTLVALVMIPLLAIPMRRAGRRVYAARGATQRKHAELTAYLQEVLGISGALLVHEGTSVGTVFVFATVLTQRFGMAAGSLGETQVNLMGSLALFRRIFTVLDFPCDVADRPGARDIGD